MVVVSAGTAAAQRLKKGDTISVINTNGQQVVDFFAFSPSDTNVYLSMVHTRTILAKISLRKGDKLYNNRRQPILTMVEDTTTFGVHDMLWAACDVERYRMLGVTGYHDNCTDNVHQALQSAMGNYRIPEKWVPDPLNLFMNVTVDHRGGLTLGEPMSEPGQFVTFRAEADLLVVMSACPQDLLPINGTGPSDFEYMVSEQPHREADRLPSTIALNRRIKIAISIDFDALSHWLGTSCHPDNKMSDYSTGVFSAVVGAKRMLSLLNKHGIADKVTWFIPGHTTETFPDAAREIAKSGAEIGLHGYSHEGVYQMTEEQEHDVLLKSIEVAKNLSGKMPRGYRAPLYTIRESTVKLLRKYKFLYDSSLSHHDSQPYFTPSDPPLGHIDYAQPASSWLHPSIVSSLDRPKNEHPLVELPCGWYSEDMTPLQYFPNVNNSQGFTSARVVEQMWKDRFLWLYENVKNADGEPEFMFPILLHPDTSGMAHIIGMIDRVIQWLVSGYGDSIEFCTHERIAADWLEKN